MVLYEPTYPREDRKAIALRVAYVYNLYKPKCDEYEDLSKWRSKRDYRFL